MVPKMRNLSFKISLFDIVGQHKQITTFIYFDVSVYQTDSKNIYVIISPRRRLKNARGQRTILCENENDLLSHA